MIFNIGEKTDVTLAALVFFWGSEADRRCLVMTALSELDIHTWPARWEQETQKKLPQEEIFSLNVEPGGSNSVDDQKANSDTLSAYEKQQYWLYVQPIFILSWQLTYSASNDDVKSTHMEVPWRCYTSQKVRGDGWE